MEGRGLIESRPQAGYYVRHRSRTMVAPPDAGPLQEPAYVGINNLLMRVLMANEDPGIVPLGSAWPLDELLPMKRMQIPIYPRTGPLIDALELALNAGVAQAVLLVPKTPWAPEPPKPPKLPKLPDLPKLPNLPKLPEPHEAVLPRRLQHLFRRYFALQAPFPALRRMSVVTHSPFR